MVDHDEDEDLQMALRMSLQGSPPEAKRSKPIDAGPPEDPLGREYRLQREILAAAAERRISMMAKTSTPAVTVSPLITPASASPSKPMAPASKRDAVSEPPRVPDTEEVRSLDASKPASSGADSSGHAVLKEEKEEVGRVWGSGEELTPEVADKLFTMLFGSTISQGILSRWSNQGIRFSSDPDTCIGLVQHEGGPCGVLAAIQAYVLKYLVFFPDELARTRRGVPAQSLNQNRWFHSSNSSTLDFTNITEYIKIRALARSMLEILFLCGSKRRAVIATLDVFRDTSEDSHEILQEDEVVSKALEGLALESAADFHKIIRFSIYDSETSAYNRLKAELPVYQSRMGAMLFLISALLSRGLVNFSLMTFLYHVYRLLNLSAGICDFFVPVGLQVWRLQNSELDARLEDSIQADRDDPSLPLVTAPFGHASQEIVNLLLCGQAAPNVFDGSMDLGGGMSLKGIPSSVEVGFLTLLESLNFCKVGQNLKCPKWPIWVVGSESHYSVLFALDKSVQDENELELQESRIHRAFDAHDQSGGGGFISVESFDQVLRDVGISLPPDKLDNLRSMGFIVWSEFWQVLLEVDKSLGGMKDSAMGKKQFDIYHFNGIAKSVLNGGSNQASGSEASPAQRPRLCKLSVSVPPRWTQEEYMADILPGPSEGGSQYAKDGNEIEVNQPSQHCPLVDCIRTRWPRATCRWVGDPPSIV